MKTITTALTEAGIVPPFKLLSPDGPDGYTIIVDSAGQPINTRAKRKAAVHTLNSFEPMRKESTKLKELCIDFLSEFGKAMKLKRLTERMTPLGESIFKLEQAMCSDSSFNEALTNASEVEGL